MKVEVALEISELIVGYNAPVNTPEEFDHAQQLLVEVVSARKCLDLVRKTEEQPARTALAEVAAKWQARIGPLSRAEAWLRSQVAAYTNEQQRARQAAMEEAARAAQANQPAAVREALTEAAQATTAMVQGVGSRTVFTWELEDINKVPDEYLTVVINNDAVNQAVKKGVREIPGIRVFEKTSLTVRSR